MKCDQCGQDYTRPPYWIDAPAWRWMVKAAEPAKWLWLLIAIGLALTELNPAGIMDSFPPNWGAEEWVIVFLFLYLLPATAFWIVRGVGAAFCWGKQKLTT